MSTQTVYKSTIDVPVYASWKCEKCGEINFSVGIIRCLRQESTSSFRREKHEEAKRKAAECAQAEWAENAFAIMADPNHQAMALRNNLFLKTTNCTKCGTKPKWDKNMNYLPIFSISIPAMIISGLLAFSLMTDVVAWIIFLASLSAFVACFFVEPRYKKMMADLPKEYSPVIGSSNAELIAYARSRGKAIPTPEKCFEIVQQNGEVPHQWSAENKQMVERKAEAEAFRGNVNSFGDTVKKTEYTICPKCGKRNTYSRNFCSDCGAKLIKSDTSLPKYDRP